jgi:hypothetical protein
MLNQPINLETSGTPAPTPPKWAVNFEM